MTDSISRRGPSRTPAGGPSPFTLVTGALLFFTVPAAAQSFQVSTSSNTTVGGVAMDDSSLLDTEAGGATPFFTEGHWLATIGFVPTDIDGFGRRPGLPPGSAASCAFSLLSNEGGFLDGDVLTFAPGGGLEIVISETELLAALGTPLANIDVDALDFDGQGCLYFSLQDDLPGTILGSLEDGDVLCYEPQIPKISITKTEIEIQTLFSMATGLGSSITDVQAVEFVAGELWVVTQSPSSHDGSVLECSAAPSIVADEAAFGLGGAELDALSLVDPLEFQPVLDITPRLANPGQTVTVTLRAEPNTVYIGLMSGAAGWVDFSARAGFGAFYFDAADPWLNTILGMAGPPHAMTDSSGLYTTSWTLPSSAVYGLGFGQEEGWSFQVMEVPTLKTSAPVRIEKL